ncbi:hypothetical protein DFH08DRAFT_975506 [Mycena albidolilacea]|uniref:Uncharacterized protein n=1 Tax=Mycena albidolilacea TaxID=1033008 RepID=A0AAD6Z4Z3_9AGAR|nr:hypothetical protein DFH08DRAFT_975506 [Mycena albidolilacea]
MRPPPQPPAPSQPPPPPPFHNRARPLPPSPGSAPKASARRSCGLPSHLSPSSSPSPTAPPPLSPPFSPPAAHLEAFNARYPRTASSRAAAIGVLDGGVHEGAHHTPHSERGCVKRKWKAHALVKMRQRLPRADLRIPRTVNLPPRRQYSPAPAIFPRAVNLPPLAFLLPVPFLPVSVFSAQLALAAKVGAHLHGVHCARESLREQLVGEGTAAAARAGRCEATAPGERRSG